MEIERYKGNIWRESEREGEKEVVTNSSGRISIPTILLPVLCRIVDVPVSFKSHRMGIWNADDNLVAGFV
jgi:hypothetical protein